MYFAIRRLLRVFEKARTVACFLKECVPKGLLRVAGCNSDVETSGYPDRSLRDGAMRFFRSRGTTVCLAIMVVAIGWICQPLEAAEGDDKLRVATFVVDVTPPLGSPLCYGYVKPAAEVVDPLTARGVVLLGTGKPIVLCVADFVGIGNASHDLWREALAEAAGTTADRVAMHSVHNHDSPGYDTSTDQLLEGQGLGGKLFDRKAHDASIAKVAAAVKQSCSDAVDVTKVGFGSGTVEKFASSRRLIDGDGKLELSRMSSGGRNPKAAEAREGVIDPDVSLLTFRNGTKVVAALTWYASHPQSYYGRGGISADTVGWARRLAEEKTGVRLVHFDGAGGDVAAGKYNDGKEKRREELAQRLAAGIEAAWEAQNVVPVSAGDVDWLVKPVEIPWRGLYTEEQLHAELTNAEISFVNRTRAARDLVFYRRWKEGHRFSIQRLRIGDGDVLFFPGELFVEYQLAAKQLRPENFVAVAAYGDTGVGYIGTAVAYEQGGYEVSRVSRTGSSVEETLLGVTKELLKRE